MRSNNRWIAPAKILLLLAFFAQAVTSMTVKSPTVDEQAHLTRGYIYLEQGSMPFKIGHPIFANALNALPVWALVNLPLPSDPTLWQDNRWGEFADQFIWQTCQKVDLVFFLGRYVTVALGLLFAALVFRWASQLWTGLEGLIALGLFVFDPNIVAHSRLITDDVAVSLFYFAATYYLWQYLENNKKRDLAAAGIVFGLAQGCKFSALVLVPALSGMIFLWVFLHSRHTDSCIHRLGRRVVDLLILFAIGAVTIWAIYGFEFKPLADSSIPIPATSYFEDMIWETRYFGRTGYVFMNNTISSEGWWYYFLMAFLIKSPLPALVLITVAPFAFRHLPPTVRTWVLLLPAAFYAVSTLVIRLNIGYRFFMPVLPYLYVFAAGALRLLRRYKSILVTSVLVWSAVIALKIHPDYLSYFNLIAGGPDNGYGFLVDSNLDWGQDLPALRRIIEDQQLERIKLSYFGTAHPSCYGIDFEPLPTWNPAPEQGNPATRRYSPLAPAPGVYAISATNLQGVVFRPEQWNTFEWFRTKEPFAKAGYSIFLYRVEPSGPPVDVALSGIQIEKLTTETIDQFGSNDLHLRWFDADTSFIIPSEPGWAIADSSIQVESGWSKGHECTTADSSPCILYPPDQNAHARALAWVDQLSATSQAWYSPEVFPSAGEPLFPLSLPASLDNELSFLGYDLEITDVLSITTAWRVSARPSSNRAIFIHLLTPDGSLAAQWDGLDVPVEGWREGDTIIQKASIPLRDEALSNSYWLQVGVYDPTTMERLAIISNGSHVTDRILLQPINPGDTPP